MSIASTTRKAGPYIGNGLTTIFTFSFKVFAASDLVVVRADLDALETTLTLATDYTVSLNANQDSNPGGTITLSSTLASGYTVTLTSAVPQKQPVVLTNMGGFYPSVINDALDRLTIFAQELAEKVGRAATIPISVTGANAEFPIPEANKFLTWNDTATGLQNVDGTGLATIVAFGTANADVFSGTGSQTVFTLTANPGALNNLDVSIAGVTQKPSIDYTWVSGTTLTFVTAPPSGTNNILVRYLQGLPQGYADWNSLTNCPIVDVKRFGATGNGSSDDSNAFQSALNSISTSGGTIFVPAGTYKASNLTLYSNVNVVLDDAATISPYDVTKDVFIAQGTQSSSIALTANAISGATTLTVSSTTGLAAGDWIVLRDTADYSTDSDAVGYKSGESCLILSVDSSVGLTLKKPIYGSMQADRIYSVANGSAIYKITPKTNINVTGGKIVMSASNNTAAIRYQYVRYGSVSKVKISNIGGQAIDFRTAIDCRASLNTISDGTDNLGLGLPGYGVTASYACQNIVVSENTMFRLRHGFTTLGGQGTPNNVSVINNVVYDCTNTGLDTHESGRDIFIRNNTVVDCLSGINLRTGWSSIENNNVSRCSTTTSALQVNATNIENVKISNNFVRGVAYGINVPCAINNLTISDNVLTNVGYDGIRSGGGTLDTFVSKNIDIKNNTIINVGTSAVNRFGIYILSGNANDVNITGNIVDAGSGSVNYGIRTAPNILGNVSKNIFKGTFVSANYFLENNLLGNFDNNTTNSLRRRKIVLAANTAVLIPLSTDVCGVVTIGSASDGSGYPNGSFYIRPNVSPRCANLALATLTNITLTTTTVLTGTTGVAGNTTISVVNGGMYVENRLAVSNTMWIDFNGILN